MNRHAQRIDLLTQHQRPALIELHRHQARRELHDVRLQPELPQRIRRLQTQQAAANDDTALAMTGAGGNGIQVVQRAIDKAAFAVVAWHRRHKRA